MPRIPQDCDDQLRIYAARVHLLTARAGVVPPSDTVQRTTAGCRHQRSTAAAETNAPGTTTDSPPVRQQNNGEWLNAEAAASGRFNVALGESVGNRYKVISVLGHGTFAVTVECWDRELKKCCAVKIVDAEYSRDAEDEIDTMQRLCAADAGDEYPLMKIQRYFINDQGHVCIAMPKYGPSLHDHIKARGALRHEARRLAEIIFHCGVALDFLHSETRMVHTDLKPSNILLEADSGVPGSVTGMLPGRVRICDFGGCHIASEVQGQIVSPRGYRAPEVMLGLGWLYAADMWSMGCVIYELYTGVPLYPARSDLEHLHLIEKTLGRGIPAAWSARCSESARGLFDAATGRLQPLTVPSRDAVRDVIGNPQLADLVSGLLECDQTKRLTAREMATHPFVEEYFPDALLHPNHPHNRGPFAEVTWPRTKQRPVGEEESSRAASMRGPRPEAAGGLPVPPVDLSPDAGPADAVEPDERDGIASAAADQGFVDLLLGAACFMMPGTGAMRERLRSAVGRPAKQRVQDGLVARNIIAVGRNGDKFTLHPSVRDPQLRKAVPWLLRKVLDAEDPRPRGLRKTQLELVNWAKAESMKPDARPTEAAVSQLVELLRETPSEPAQSSTSSA